LIWRKKRRWKISTDFYTHILFFETAKLAVLENAFELTRRSSQIIEAILEEKISPS